MTTPLLDRSSAGVAIATILLILLVLLLFSLFQTYRDAIEYQREVETLADDWRAVDWQSEHVINFEESIRSVLEGEVLGTLAGTNPDLRELVAEAMTAWERLGRIDDSRSPRAFAAAEDLLEERLSLLDDWFEEYNESQLNALEQMFILLGMATLLTGVLLIATTLVMGKEQTARSRARNQLRTVLEIQEEERRRIAQDLHDDLAQEITSAKMTVTQLRESVVAPNPALLQGLENVGAILETTLNTTRAIAYGLRPVHLEHFGIAPAVENLCRDAERIAGTRIDFSAVGLRLVRLPEAIEINLFRIIQEAINNALRHADADRIGVRLVSSHPWLIARIEDNGKGFSLREDNPTPEGAGMGLNNMRERVELVGGRFRINSGSDGTSIEVRVPLSHGEAGR